MRKKHSANWFRDGFTIVELVIVIAVVAILAAVLIPSFAGIIQKANQSKQTQEDRNERLMERIGEIEQGSTSSGSSQGGQTEQGGESGQSGDNSQSGGEPQYTVLDPVVIGLGDTINARKLGIPWGYNWDYDYSASDSSVLEIGIGEVSCIGVGDAELTVDSPFVSGVGYKVQVTVLDNARLKAGAAFKNAIKNLTFTDIVFGYTWEHENVAVQENRQNVDVRATGSPEIGVFLSNGTLYLLSEGNILANTDCSSMFLSLTGLETVTFENFDARNVTSMGSMFSGCSALTSIEFGKGFDTGSVTSFKYMFNGCGSLENLDLTGFNTINATTMQEMFRGCNNLVSITGIETFITSSLSDTSAGSSGAMTGMFQNCSSLKGLDLRSFDTSGVKTMQNIFNGCSSLEGVLFGSGFVNANVTNLAFMFRDCSSLVTLDLSGFDTFEVTNMYFMFSGCSNLESIYVTADPGSPGADPNGRWSVEKATNSTSMFNGCTNLPHYTESALDKQRANTIKKYGYLTDK